MSRETGLLEDEDEDTAAADEEEFNPTAIPDPAEEGAEIAPTVIDELEPWGRNYNHASKQTSGTNYEPDSGRASCASEGDEYSMTATSTVHTGSVPSEEFSCLFQEA